MLNSELSQYTNVELSQYTNYYLATATALGEVKTYIFDRTSQDVERWKELRDKGLQNMTDLELQEWFGEIKTTPAATKGMYTHNDMNRVEIAVSRLSERLSELGYTHATLSTKTDWARYSVATRNDMIRYYGNVKTLRDSIAVYANTPTAPTVGARLDYKLANDIEKILKDIDEITTNLTKTWIYAGEIVSGEV